eukprot:1148720-Pelagomonas_calceolata.AAC.2
MGSFEDNVVAVLVQAASVHLKLDSPVGFESNLIHVLLLTVSALQHGKLWRRHCCSAGAGVEPASQLPARFPWLWAAPLLEEGAVQDTQQL